MADSPLRDEILESASAARLVDVDGTKTEARSLDELIKADQYLAANDAAGRRRLPVRICKVTPGGAV